MKEPIRVLQMTSSLFRGGSQTMIINIYKNIDRSKIQFDFIIDHPEFNELQQEVESLGARVYIMPKFNGLNYFKVKKAWRDFFSSHPEYKIIHSHSRSYASIYLSIAKKQGLKTIIHSHNTSNGSGIKSFIKSVLQFPLRYIADYYFACSPDSGKWLFGEKIVKSDKFYVLKNAIDVNKFKFDETIRKEYRKHFNVDDKKVYIQIGEFNEQKNHRFTIELFERISKNEENAVLFLIGKGEYLENIKNKILQYNLQDKIFILSNRDDVNKLLQMSDVYLMPSNWEGLSVAAIEAQASGIVTLLSDKVSRDVDISNNCKFLPLQLDVWEKECYKSFDKHKMVDNEITAAGYNIASTSKWISDFYSKIV